MAGNSKLSNVAASTMAGDGDDLGLLPVLAGGKLALYSGVQPADPDTGLSGNTLIATYTFPTPAGTVSNGVLTLGTVAAVTAVATATATWFRIYESDFTGANDATATRLWDGNAGVAAGTPDLVLSTAAIVSGGTCGALTGGTLTVPTD